MPCAKLYSDHYIDVYVKRNRYLVLNCEQKPLLWRHNGLDGVSNHHPHHCLLSRLFGRRSKKTSKLCVSGLCAGNSPGTGEFPVQMASNAENVSIWWRHHDTLLKWPVSRQVSDGQLLGIREVKISTAYAVPKPGKYEPNKACFVCFLEQFKKLRIAWCNSFYLQTIINFNNSVVQWRHLAAVIRAITGPSNGSNPLSEPMLSYCQLDPQDFREI